MEELKPKSPLFSTINHNMNHSRMKKLVLFAGLAALGAFPALAQSPSVTFNARGLVAISDADMAASALVDGKLLRDNTVKDKLTSIKLPLVRGGASVGEIVVPNSTLTYSKSMAVPKTGGLAFVLESRGAPGETVNEFPDAMQGFPDGQKLYVVDIVNLAKPKVNFGFAVGKNPTAIDIYKNNELMVSTRDEGKELVFLETDDSGKPTRFLALPAELEGPNSIIDLSWHPTGNFLAVTLEGTKEVALYKVLRDAGKLKNIEKVGTPLKVGDSPTVGRFSEDGKYYYVMDTKGALGKASGAGALHVVEFSLTGGEHKVNGNVPVGTNPSAFAISPDGSMVVVANANNSAQPWEQSGAEAGSALTLYSLADGALTKVADYPFPGILPQSVVFDKDGANLAVAVYEYLDYGSRTGGVEFWTVTKGGTPSLTKQMGRISVERGCHTVRVIP